MEIAINLRNSKKISFTALKNNYFKNYGNNKLIIRIKGVGLEMQKLAKFGNVSFCRVKSYRFRQRHLSKSPRNNFFRGLEGTLGWQEGYSDFFIF